MSRSRRTINILVTAASRRVPLVRAFRKALDELGLAGRVVVTDVNALSPAVRVADRAYAVPMSSEPSYLGVMRTICAAEAIDLLVPTIDDELSLFASSAEAFASQGTRVVISERPTTDICDDKLATCRHLRRAGLAAAATYLPHEVPSPLPLPLFVKPRRGRGSVGAFPARTEEEFRFFSHYVQGAVVQEYLDGEEYTIDLLCDFDGRPLSVVPRQRAVIRAGVIDRGRTSDDPRLIGLGLACASALRFAGPANIQCRMVNGAPVIFEINPRFSGGIPLTIAAGADFPRMLVELALGRTVEPVIGRFEADLWMSSYEASFFVEGARVAELLLPPGVPNDEAA